MVKPVVRQGRSERTCETYAVRYVAVWPRCENDAGDRFHHPGQGDTFQESRVRRMAMRERGLQIEQLVHHLFGCEVIEEGHDAAGEFEV